MEYLVRRVTYDKLERALNALAAEAWVIEAPVYIGGRDWVLVCKRGLR